MKNAYWSSDLCTAPVAVFMSHNVCRMSAAAVSVDDIIPCCYCLWKDFEDNRCFACWVFCIHIRWGERKREKDCHNPFNLIQIQLELKTKT